MLDTNKYVSTKGNRQEMSSRIIKKDTLLKEGDKRCILEQIY